MNTNHNRHFWIVFFSICSKRECICTPTVVVSPARFATSTISISINFPGCTSIEMSFETLIVNMDQLFFEKKLRQKKHPAMSRIRLKQNKEIKKLIKFVDHFFAETFFSKKAGCRKFSNLVKIGIKLNPLY